MDLRNKILIIIIILIFTYILMRLFWKRAILQKNYEYNIVPLFEGYQNQNVNGVSTANSSPLNIKDDLLTRIANIKTITGVDISNSLSLYNYGIKASMNTAFNGTECTTDMINYVLTRGCRYLDFAVFRDPATTNSVVSISTGSDFTIPISQTNPLVISDTLNYLSQYAFNSTCPNPSDPLFIQFRPREPSYDDKTAQTFLKQILNDIYSACSTYITGSFKYNGKITPKTPIISLINKVIIIMDTTLYPNYATLSPNLGTIVNMDNNLSSSSGGTVTFLYSNLPQSKPLKLSSDTFTCSVNNTITQSLWIDTKNIDYTTNANSYNLYKNYSCQIVPMLYYNNGSDLYNNEMLFNNCGGGIVPMSLIYSKVNVSTTPYVAYPEPIFALPNYGNQTISIIVIIGCLGIAGFIIYKERS